MKKLPNGISNYEELIEENYYYVDKTQYIEKLESLSDKRIMFLRPRKFGKTLFTSTLENYYDINKKDKFEKLYRETYIGKNPTKLRNSYHILRFNFSGIDTENEETTMKAFRESVEISIKYFIQRYNIDFYINYEQTIEGMLNNLFEAFKIQKSNEKIYVIIDEYDHFANELLGFHTNQFKKLVSKNGKVRKWYEVLKRGTESVVDRIFITGVAPITLDSLTSGFNISKDITRDEEFNEMMGFTKLELQKMMKDQEITVKEQENLLPIMKENYDGYKFSIYAKQNIYNSNMCLFFLSDYKRLGRIPEHLVDVNIASDYSKLGKMLDLCKGEKRVELLNKTVSGEGITTQITEKFNPEIEFTERDMTSMLYYLGYLTIEGEDIGFPKLNVPNKVMMEIYSDYFLKIVQNEINIDIEDRYVDMAREVALEGNIDKIIEVLQLYLNNLSNRDFQRFDEKYIKVIFYCIAMNLKIFSVKSELEINRRYPDILLIPRDNSRGYHSVMIEFKYLKKGQKVELQKQQQMAREQIEEYAQFEDIKHIENLNKYVVVCLVDKIYVYKV